MLRCQIMLDSKKLDLKTLDSINSSEEWGVNRFLTVRKMKIEFLLSASFQDKEGKIAVNWCSDLHSNIWALSKPQTRMNSIRNVLFEIRTLLALTSQDLFQLELSSSTPEMHFETLLQLLETLRWIRQFLNRQSFWLVLQVRLNIFLFERLMSHISKRYFERRNFSKKVYVWESFDMTFLCKL